VSRSLFRVTEVALHTLPSWDTRDCSDDAVCLGHNFEKCEPHCELRDLRRPDQVYLLVAQVLHFKPQHLSLEAQMMEPADQPFIDAARALLKAEFLFANHPQRPYLAYDLTLAQMDVLIALARAEDASLSCSEIAERTLITKGGITLSMAQLSR
jgi:hypothetical protein